MAISDYWPLTDGSGDTASNTVRSSNDGIIIGSPTWITDSPNGGGLHFNGAEGWWHCPNWYTSEPRYYGMQYVTTQVLMSCESFAISAWFRIPPDEASGGPILSYSYKTYPTATGVESGLEHALSVYRPPLIIYVDPAGLLNAYVFASWLPESGPPPYYSFDGYRSTRRYDDGGWHNVIFRYCFIVAPDGRSSRAVTTVLCDGEIVGVRDPSMRLLTTGSTYPYWHIGGVGWVGGWGCGTQTIFPPGQESIAAVPRSFHGDITNVRLDCGCVSDADLLARVRFMPADTGVYVLSGSQTNVLKPGAFDVTGNPIAVGLSMAARPGEYVVAGQPARLIADVVTPPEVEPNPIWFSCNT